MISSINGIRRVWLIDTAHDIALNVSDEGVSASLFPEAK